VPPARLLRAVLVAMLFGCGEKAPPFANTTMPSGRVVRLLSYVPENLFTGEEALVFKFFPDAPLDDARALDAEVAELWKDVKLHAEQQGDAKLVLIRALSTPNGGWDPGRQYQYVYRRQADGKWDMQKDPEVRLH
jgi:hypothetical protein